ncbi:isochorismatase family cysteine hydrolase [Streptodolium elevatio]|uniref:Isochorismatase family cysteine hydrolase n=1 Tax=Streptodolium elevatio TaxID=3157996 RepID=A0ABV3DJW6_9ACTN
MNTAVLVIDMINTYDHEDAELLLPSVRQAVPGVRTVLDSARKGGVDVIYVNDNFGRWRSDHTEVLQAALEGPYGDLVRPVQPDEGAMFVMKTRHSVFFQTPLQYLLEQHKVRHVVLCGQVTEQCVLYSAIDAHVRHLEVTVVQDAVAHIHADLAQAALRMMERNLGARLSTARDVDLS